jgi:ketosteroid isomerase-like protein
MKKSIFAFILVLSCFVLNAQQNDLEKFIRDLEQKEVKAVLAKDTVLLKTMWSEDMTVNSPFNQIVKAGKTTVDRPVISRLNYASFQRNIEYVLIKGGIIITMGNELVVEKGDKGTPGRTIKRRYTNVWMNEDGKWKIIARHANEIK